MALTRKFLKGLDLTDEQISAIIEAHTETTDALKEERDNFKADAEKLPKVQKELDELKASETDYKQKYEKEHSDFEAYKNEKAAESTKAAKKDKFTNVLKELKVSEKVIPLILNTAKYDDIELDEAGNIKDIKTLTDKVKEEYADFITTEHNQGVGTKTPPGNAGGKKMTKEEILGIKDIDARQSAIAENHELFGF